MRQGLVRVEVSVPKTDAILIQQIAGILADPARQASARVILQQNFGAMLKFSLKALLASAPLDGIVLERDHDTGRAVAL